MLCNEFHAAAKSSLVFAGRLHHFSEFEPFVRIIHSDRSLLFVSADQYAVAFVRVESDGPDFEIVVSAEDLKNSLPHLKCLVRDKVEAKVSVVDGILAVHRSDEETVLLPQVPEMKGVDLSMFPWRLPAAYPVFDQSGDVRVPRVAVTPDLFARFKQAAHKPTDALIFEPGPTPHLPITARLGDYLVAKVMPRQVEPDAEVRESWNELLGPLGFTASVTYHDCKVVKIREEEKNDPEPGVE